MPRVSVVMPARNRAWCIREAIESVLWQDMADWELALVDDASDDDTYAIMQAYAARDSRIRAYTTGTAAERQARIDDEARDWPEYTGATGGEGPARNLGIRATSGEYYACLDSDDVWERWHLATLTGYLDAHPDIGAATGRSMLIRKDGTPMRTGAGGYMHPERIANGLLFSPMLAHSALVVRRNLLEAAWLYAPLAFAADWDLFQRLMEGGCQFVGLPQWTVRVRHHDAHMGRFIPSADHQSARSYVYPRGLRLRGGKMEGRRAELYSDLVGAHDAPAEWWRCSLGVFNEAARYGGGAEAGRMALFRWRMGGVERNQVWKPLPRWWLLWILGYPRLTLSLARWGCKNWVAYWLRNRRECRYVRENPVKGDLCV